MTVVLLTGDLMVVSRVSGAAAAKGVALQTVAGVGEAVEACRSHVAERLIVDLASPSLDVAELVAAAKSGEGEAPKIVAFGPHVHEARLAAAREAGCDVVMSRGQFMRQLEMLL